MLEEIRGRSKGRVVFVEEGGVIFWRIGGGDPAELDGLSWRTVFCGDGGG